MLNQNQISKMNKTGEQLTADTGIIAPLKMEVAANTTSNRLKELRKPRSRQYMNDLAELQEMLVSLDRMKKDKQDDLALQDKKEERYLSEHNSMLSAKNNSIYQPAKRNLLDIEDSDESFKGQADHDLSFEVVSDRIQKTVMQEKEIHSSYEGTTENAKLLINNPELEALEKRIEEKLRQMAEVYPLIRELLSMIYPESEEEYLISCGAIQGHGRTVYSREDMAVNVHDPKVAEQLKRGYDVYMQYHDSRNFLCLEIYIDAFCIIYKDGIVKTVE